MNKININHKLQQLLAKICYDQVTLNCLTKAVMKRNTNLFDIQWRMRNEYD